MEGKVVFWGFRVGFKVEVRLVIFWLGVSVDFWLIVFLKLYVGRRVDFLREKLTLEKGIMYVRFVIVSDVYYFFESVCEILREDL